MEEWTMGQTICLMSAIKENERDEKARSDKAHGKKTVSPLAAFQG